MASRFHPGDLVSTLTRAWGDQWARHVHGKTWMTGVTKGNVLEILLDGKVRVDFGEDDSEHATWEAQVLTLVSAAEPPTVMPAAAAATKRKAKSDRKQADRGITQVGRRHERYGGRAMRDRLSHSARRG